MATFVITNPVITVAGTDFSDHVDSVEINAEAADVKTTNFGSGGNETRVGGLKSGSITISFQQDYAAGSVDATLFANLGSVVAITAKASSAATSATNPLFSGNYLISQMKPISGKPGDLAVFSCTFARSGALTRATS